VLETSNMIEESKYADAALVLDEEEVLEASNHGARVLGRGKPEALTSREWRDLLHPEATTELKRALETAKSAPGAWVDVGRVKIASPGGGWVAVRGRVRSLPEHRFEWRVQRSGAEEKIEGWDAIAWWLGVSERTARRWAAEPVDPIPVDRASNGRISISLMTLQTWRDRRELELLRGWDAIAEHLGVSERTARRWHKQGLPVERRGGRWIGRPDTLTAWRDAKRSKKSA